MPSSKNYVRDYKQEYKTAKKRGEVGTGSGSGNAKRHRLRREMLKLGMVKPGQDVDHKKPAYVGSLIGIKATLNEFVAYAQFGADLASGRVIDPRSAIILTYALLGFANFSSIAIQIGGIGGLAPERKAEIAGLGLRAMIAGNLAAFMSASLAGMLV